MVKAMEPAKLRDGTLIRHKVTGYEGRIEGITEIKGCFTAAGVSLNAPNSKQIFQYRVAVTGEPMRRIAPVEDLEILEEAHELACPGCGYHFHSKPGVENKPAGRCACGGWICPACLACQGGNNEPSAAGVRVCLKQRQRQTRKLVARNKRRGD